MKDIVRGAHFREVDAAPAPRALLATLDAVAAREGVRRLKRRGLDMLAVTAGQRLLDVGCGMGDDVRALADLTGPSGLVIGVEPSEVLLSEAQRRTADSPLPLGFAAGDARDLPFPAGSFDACRAERVFQHLPDPLRALREMIRVTRPGGHVLVLDTDWGTTAVNGADRRVTRRILEGFGDHITQGWIGRQLPGLFHQAGLKDIVVAAETSWSRELSAATEQPCPRRAPLTRAPSPRRKRATGSTSWRVPPTPAHFCGLRPASRSRRRHRSPHPDRRCPAPLRLAEHAEPWRRWHLAVGSGRQRQRPRHRVSGLARPVIPGQPGHLPVRAPRRHRMPSHSARSAGLGSSMTVQVSANRITGRRPRS